MKLHSYSIRSATLRWIQAFLGYRQQKVVVEGEESDSVTVKSGVPQGSVLGPILFLVYINDKVSQVRLFADDTAIYLTLENQSDSDKLQMDLDKLQTWEARWDVEFNPSKCQVVRVISSRTPLQTHYILHGQVLEAVSSASTWGGYLQQPQLEHSCGQNHSDLLDEISKLSPLKSQKWLINP